MCVVGSSSYLYDVVIKCDIQVCVCIVGSSGYLYDVVIK